MRLFAIIILFSSILFSISAEDGLWPFTSSYWKQVTLEELEKVIETDIDINAADTSGYTALLYAAGLSNDPEIITLLLEKDAEIEKHAGLFKKIIYGKGLFTVLSIYSSQNIVFHSMLLKHSLCFFYFLKSRSTIFIYSI